MARYIVIDDAVYNLPTGPMVLRAGQLLDDGQVDIPNLQAQGIPLLAFTDGSPAATALARYIQAPTTRSLVGLLSASGALSGPAGDAHTPLYVVGNAPAGDTSDSCTHLDTGDGDAYRDALADAVVTGGGVYVLRGDYELRPSGAAGPTVVDGSVAVRGEGDRTRLVLPSSGEMLALQVAGLMERLAITMASNPGGALLDGDANRFINVSGGARLVRCLIACQASAGTVSNFPGFWTMLRMTDNGALLNACRLRTYSSVALGAGSVATAAQATGQRNRIENCIFGDSGAANQVDIGVELGEGSFNSCVGSTIHRSRVAGVLFVVVGGDVVGTKVSGCDITVDSGWGVNLDFFGNAGLIAAQVRDTTVVAAAGASGGVRFASPDAARPVTSPAVQGCVLRGGGAGTGLAMTVSGTGALTSASDLGNHVGGFSTQRGGTALPTAIGAY